MEKALENKEEKLFFPPEQRACLPYIDKLSHELQGMHFNSMGRDFKSVLSPRKGLQLQKSLDFVPPSQLRSWMVITWLWKTLIYFQKTPRLPQVTERGLHTLHFPSIWGI